jgi:gliding motility-associated-like protein
MRKLTACLLFLFYFLSGHSTTFIVTSNADSGPGSLREAITLANSNGVIVNDVITFNIADVTEAGRTISLQSQLPQLSSNITIDGSTQSGVMLGISSAKVILYVDHFMATPFVYLYLNNAVNVKIFGLCFKFFDNPNAGSGYYYYAIYLRNSSGITIGAPGKGNLFSAVRSGITNNFHDYHTDSIKGITIQSNVFGLNSTNYPVDGGFSDLIRASEVTIGGPAEAEGNVLVGAGIQLSQVEATRGQFFARIQNNKFNLTWNGSTYWQFKGGGITLYGSQTDDSISTKTYILDNISSGGWPSGLTMINVYHRAEVKGNKWQTDVTGNICKGGYNEVKFIQCKNVVFGGYQRSEENIIANTVYNVASKVNIIRSEFGGIFLNRPVLQPNDPFIKILTYNGGLITGLATPNAKVQLYSNRCNVGCIDRKYLATVFADGTGRWSFPYTSSMPNIIGTATNTDSVTSEFSRPSVKVDSVVIKHPTCGRSNGSIKGLSVVEGTHIEWRDMMTWQIISTDTNLINAPAGNYAFLVYNGANGCPFQQNYYLIDKSPPQNINTSLTHASCGGANGNISTDLSSFSHSWKWLNSNSDSIGNNSYILNLFPGAYSLKVWVTGDTSCNKTFGPFIITNQSGPSLNVSTIQITPATCGNSSGSITGITASNITGSPFIRWVDSLNNPVGSNYDLTNVPPGKYRLKFKDGSGCDTIVTQFFMVGNNGDISINEANILIAPAKCTGNTGSIQNIQVTGATSFVWQNITTTLMVGNTVNVSNLAAGSYQLTASNSLGCTKNSSIITVRQASFIPIAVAAWGTTSSNCGKANGSAHAQRFNRDTAVHNFRWVDSASNQTVGTSSYLANVFGGRYFLFAIDTNGCEKKILSVNIGVIPQPTFDYSNMVVKPDQCLNGEGAINNLMVKDMRGGTGTFVWLNANGDSVNNMQNAANLSQGTYRLKATDLLGCTVISNPVAVTNVNISLADPKYDEQVVLRNESATLTVRNPSRGLYTLYSQATATQVLHQNTTGIFSTPSVANDQFFYIQLKRGVCSSAVVPVMVKVVDKIIVYVPSAFTPNGDGQNDILRAIPRGRVKLLRFEVYDRWGQKIFGTNDFSKGWNGKVNGQPADSGVYVWIVQAIDETNGKKMDTKGTVTVIR